MTSGHLQGRATGSSSISNMVTLQSDRANVIALSVVWLALAVLVNPVGDFPVQDDWTYALAVRSLIDDGVYRIPGFVSANLGPLVHWGALFCWPSGFSFTALRVSTLVLGLVGVVGVYWLFREVWGDRRVAMVAAATLLVNPMYFSLAYTFMTDVPFVALISVAMALIVRGMRREDNAVLAAGLALGLVAVLVRQVALMIFIGFACAWVTRRGIRPFEIIKALTPLAVGVAAHAAFNQWLIRTGRKALSSGVSDIADASIDELAYSSAHELFAVINELGFFLLPIAILCVALSSRGRGAVKRMWPALFAIAAGAAMAIFMVAERRTMPLTGDTLHYFGIGPLMLRDTLLIGWNLPPLTASLKNFWTVMTAFALIGATLIMYTFARGSAELFDRARSVRESVVRAWPAVFIAVTGLSYLTILLLLATRHDLFDRYLLPLCIVVSLALPLLGMRSVTGVLRRAACIFVCTWLLASMCFSVISTHDFLAWNRTRWMALSDLMEKQGISPRRIDGGYEFNGWFLYDSFYEPHDEKSWWWVDDDEYMISAGPMPAYRIERRLTVDRWWPGTAPDVFVLRRNEGP